MRRMAAVTVIFMLAVTGCAATYRESPTLDRSASLPQNDVPIYYHVDPFELYSRALARMGAGFDFPYPSRDNYRELERAFAENHIFWEAQESVRVPGDEDERNVDRLPALCLDQLIHTDPY